MVWVKSQPQRVFCQVEVDRPMDTLASKPYDYGTLYTSLFARRQKKQVKKKQQTHNNNNNKQKKTQKTLSNRAN